MVVSIVTLSLSGSRRLPEQGSPSGTIPCSYYCVAKVKVGKVV